MHQNNLKNLFLVVFLYKWLHKSTYNNKVCFFPDVSKNSNIYLLSLSMREKKENNYELCFLRFLC